MLSGRWCLQGRACRKQQPVGSFMVDLLAGSLLLGAVTCCCMARFGSCVGAATAAAV